MQKFEVFFVIKDICGLKYEESHEEVAYSVIYPDKIYELSTIFHRF